MQGGRMFGLGVGMRRKRYCEYGVWRRRLFPFFTWALCGRLGSAAAGRLAAYFSRADVWGILTLRDENVDGAKRTYWAGNRTPGG